MKTFWLTVLLGLAVCTRGFATDRAPILHYTFNGGTAADASGTGNEGTVHGGEFVASPRGQALRFDGVDDFVECGMSESLKRLERAGTIEMWIKPEVLQGGLASWCNGEELKDQRLVVVFDTKNKQNAGLAFTTSDGSGRKKQARSHGLELPEIESNLLILLLLQIPIHKPAPDRLNEEQD